MLGVIIIRQKAVLVAVDSPQLFPDGLPVEKSLEELEQLVWASGAEVVDKHFQKRQKPDAAYFIGKGFAEKLAQVVESCGAELLVFDDELTGSQLRNLEEITGASVIDRTAVILDIFAKRAKSRDGKLQVELAQLEYRLPRLTGMGVELSRLAGGIGTRGPGEPKVEKEKRHIKNRMKNIEKKLQEIRKQREEKRRTRSEKISLAAIVGYTNAGKSTLRYSMLEKSPAASFSPEKEDHGTDKVFATLDPSLRGVKLPSGREILISDTVGFIRKLPHQLVSAFKATLEEVLAADIILHVVDASSDYYDQQMTAVQKVLKEIGADKIPRITVYNKIDLVTNNNAFIPEDDAPGVEVSAVTGEGIDQLFKQLEAVLTSSTKSCFLYIPYSQADSLALVYNNSLVHDVNYHKDNIIVLADVLPERMHLLKQFIRS